MNAEYEAVRQSAPGLARLTEGALQMLQSEGDQEQKKHERCGERVRLGLGLGLVVVVVVEVGTDKGWRWGDGGGCWCWCWCW